MSIDQSEYPISSWAEFAGFLEDHSDGDWIFRGVTESAHKLIPKIGRSGARKNPADGSKLPFSPAQEEEMAREFQRQARPYFVKDPISMFELLAVAQHHGMPTRLLDWTESLLVAAYFAVDLAGTKDDPPAIYALNLNKNRDNLQFIPSGRKKNNPFRLEKEVAIYKPPHISPRIPAQRGLFTVHKNPNQEPSNLNIKKLILHKGRPAFWLKLMLDRCGINRASLFPDLDGLASYMGWRYKWGKLGLPKQAT